MERCVWGITTHWISTTSIRWCLMIHHANWPYECSGVPACVCQLCDNVLNITPSIGVDIDECAENNGGCNDQAVCSNTEGSFACTCNDGFAGDGFTCTGMSSSSLSEYFLRPYPSGTTVFYCRSKSVYPTAILPNVYRSTWNLSGICSCMEYTWQFIFIHICARPAPWKTKTSLSTQNIVHGA